MDSHHFFADHLEDFLAELRQVVEPPDHWLSPEAESELSSHEEYSNRDFSKGDL